MNKTRAYMLLGLVLLVMFFISGCILYSSWLLFTLTVQIFPGFLAFYSFLIVFRIIPFSEHFTGCFNFNQAVIIPSFLSVRPTQLQTINIIGLVKDA